MQAIDQIVNSAGKTYYMSGGNVPCPVTFRGPNGAAAGVAAQHSQVSGHDFDHKDFEESLTLVLRCMVRLYPRPQGRLSLERSRLQGSLEVRHSGSQPSLFP